MKLIGDMKAYVARVNLDALEAANEIENRKQIALSLQDKIYSMDSENDSLREALRQIELSLELSEARVKADEQEILLLRTEKSDGKKDSESSGEQQSKE